MSLGVGEEFAGFRVERRLGAGGMGEVYLVRHPRLPRQEALKVLPAELSGDAQFRERFHREADVAATLFHPNIVGVHDRGEADGRLWLSMDYVAGTDLGQLLTDRYPNGLPVADAVSVIGQIADALDHAHAKGLIHRDVKPANILLADAGTATDGRVLLADFGIARKIDDDTGLTATNVAVGTVTFAAPEQLADEHVDGRADQYALAATALTLLTGRSPFAGTNPAAVISRKMRGEVPRIAAVLPQLGALDPVLATGMAQDPARRYRTCREFADALAEAARRPAGPQGYPAPAWPPVSGPTVPPGFSPAPSNPGFTPASGFTPAPSNPGFTPAASNPGFTPAPSNPGFAPAPSRPGLGSARRDGTPPPMHHVPAYAAAPAAPASRPVPVVCAAVVFALNAVLSAFLILGGAASYAETHDSADIGLILLFTVGTVASLVGAAVLFRKPTEGTRAIAAAAAGVCLLSCLGIWVTVVVPILLFAPQSSRAWLRPSG